MKDKIQWKMSMYNYLRLKQLQLGWIYIYMQILLCFVKFLEFMNFKYLYTLAKW